jgi:hypothetical protein
MRGQSGAVVIGLPSPPGKLLRRLRPGDGRESWIVWCAAFTPDGKAVALAHQSAGVTFRDKQDGCQVVLKPRG